MANKIFVVSLIFCISIGGSFTQENTQTSVAQSLIECYKSIPMNVKDYKLPMTLTTLLDLLRKIENGPDSIDLSALSVSILQRFRQDGIVKAVGLTSVQAEGVLLYSPNGRTNDKFRMVSKYMVPGSAVRFPNDTLTVVERCTLHSMLSSSIEDWERGDEAKVCSSLAKYRRRISRAVPAMHEDVEVLDDSILEVKGNIQAKHPDTEKIGQMNMPKSDCPVENGVMYTPWGAVAVGPLLSGIAAGAHPQRNINLRQINTDVKTDLQIDNLWGATLSGDLAEAALYKNEEDNENGDRIEVGAPGGWNSTESPHWYFLQKKTQLHLTDAEIRGGLDGMILGKLYRDELSQRIPSLKLSQLLDMYYSPRGVLGSKYRACGRKEMFTETCPTEEMEEQASAFAIALNKEVRLRVTLEDNAIIKMAKAATARLQEYIPSHLDDPNCLLRADIGNQRMETTAAYTDMFMVVDFSWPFEEINNIITSCLTKMDINQYTSNYTIINAYDGSTVINSTYSISDYFNVINATTYSTFPKGIDMAKVIRTTEELARELMQNEKNGQGGGGRSLTSLFMPYTDPEMSSYVINRKKDYINLYTPDLRYFVCTKGSNVYANMVKDLTNDVLIYTSDLTQLSTFLDRIKEVPRRFVNPRCGSDWKSSGNANQRLTQYITPRTINYYRIHPNYFFGEGSRAIKIKPLLAPSLTVCSSRSNIRPTANQSRSDVGADECKSITGEEYSMSLTGACKEGFIHDCGPFYFSVEAPESTDATKYSCNDPNNGCRYPDTMKFEIFGENLVCQSGANFLITNVWVIVTMLSTVLFKLYA